MQLMNVNMKCGFGWKKTRVTARRLYNFYYFFFKQNLQFGKDSRFRFDFIFVLIKKLTTFWLFFIWNLILRKTNLFGLILRRNYGNVNFHTFVCHVTKEAVKCVTVIWILINFSLKFWVSRLCDDRFSRSSS